jgi:DNA repair exonuclease SbcCD ATPase subunit
MRLRRLTVAGFRGFPLSVEFDLDADAVIVAGVNGSGKTSLFDAILWVLCGRVDRLGESSASLVSEYSPSGEARVELTLSADGGAQATVVRRFAGAMHLSVYTDAADPVTGPAADALLIELLWPDAKTAADQLLALTRSLTKATYLQQDAVRDFVDADTEQDRFQVVSELVGAGRIAELQRQLESSRNAWTRATTAVAKDVAPLEGQRRAIAEQLGRLGAGRDDDNISRTFYVWATQAAELLVPPAASGGQRIEETAEGLDRALRELAAQEQGEARIAALAQRLLDQLSSPPADAEDVEPLQAALADAQQRRAAASDALANAQTLAAEGRRRQIESNERAERLRALAQLALQHLDAHCPVCGQTYDREATQARLEALVQQTSESSSPTAPLPDIAAAAAEMEAAERAIADQQAALRDAENAAQQRTQWTEALTALSSDLGYRDGTPTTNDVSAQLLEFQRRLGAKRQLRAQGEELSLGLARAAELAQREELEQQLAQVEVSLGTQQAIIESRNATGELATQVINALRTASGDVVSKELERIEPLLQRIFATVDPHPTFRVVSFLTKTVRGKGQLWTTLDDVAGEVNVQDPGLVLSSSQLNVLAVAIFLALNLAIPTLPLQVVALDDPLQSLDTINLLGLADLLRRVRRSRQVLVSTHDERLASLLERKMRPVSSAERTVRIDLRGWTPDGPSIEQRDLPQDLAPLRLVAIA